MKEARLKVLLLDYLKKNGWYARKMNPFGNAGFPDIFAFKNGIFLGLELKQAETFTAAEKAFTKIQRKNCSDILKAGGKFILLASGRKKVFGYLWEYVGTESVAQFTFSTLDLPKFLKKFESFVIQRRGESC